MAESGERTESYLSFYFGIEIDGIEVARFIKCEGLESETYIYEVEEGGFNTGTHKFLGRTRHPNLILENGMTDNNDLYNWYKDTALTEESITRKDGSIVLYKSSGDEVKRWNFYKGLPCRWVGPKLSKENRNVAIERIEIAHEGLELA